MNNVISSSVCILVVASILFQSTTSTSSSLLNSRRDAVDIVDRRAAPRAVADNNFENGLTSPWFEESHGTVKWRVEDHSNPLEVSTSVPHPAAGTKYLRVIRNADFQSGLAVLRSPIFTANPGDKVSFDYWIHSRRPEGSNLELVWLVNGKEQVFTGLSLYSTIRNGEWRSVSVNIPIDVPTVGELIFYGFCGSSLEDAVAIDNIVVDSTDSSTTEGPGLDCIELTEVSGTFTSPNYPSNYPDNTNICWLITGADYIYLTFNSFLTEEGSDAVKIYEGRTVSSPLVATYSGTYFSSVSLYTEALLIVFTSDSFNNYKGFSAFYEYKPQQTTTAVTTEPTTSTTAMTTTQPFTPNCSSCISYNGGYNGTIQSPNYPNNYCNSLDCRYTITVPVGYRARLHFTDFQTELFYDVVNIYDGSSTTYDLLISVSGSTLPPDITASRGEMLLVFSSNNVTTFSGWRATYEALKI